ncbi:unnamed protein product, partial [Ectocarpus sp. 6 AP-2014]
MKSFLSISDLIPLPPCFTPLSSAPVRITKAEHNPGANTTAKNDPHAQPNPKSYLPKNWFTAPTALRHRRLPVKSVREARLPSPRRRRRPA